jgi:predicted RND superfamily exporter protein
LALEGKELTKYVDFTTSTANIVVRHNITSSWELSAFLGRLDAYIAKTFPPTVTVRNTGEGILIRNAADYMAINEITSFSYTFIIICLIHAWLFRSLWAGLLSLIPNVIPILFNFGLMGFLGIPLNVGTAMIATIAIGIAVDDTVYCMVTYSRQLSRYHDKKIAVLNTMKIQGRPIIYISLALAGGFLVLVFSNFVPTVYLGALSAMVMLIAMVTELVLTPILMYSAPSGLIQRRRGAAHDET